MATINGYEVLEPDGFLFQRTSLNTAGFLAKADFGDGYGRAVIIGNPAGLRSWVVRIDALPDLIEFAVVGEFGTEPRAEYLWEFYLRSKAAANRPFWIADPYDDQLYLAEFADDSLDYDILCSRLYSTGLNLKQRRVLDATSPIAAI